MSDAPPLTDTSVDGLRTAILTDFRATRLTASEAPLEVVVRPDVGYTRSTTALAIHNVVVYARFGQGGADAATQVRALVDTFRADGAPFIWWIGPDDTPDDLVELAEAAGARYYGSAPGMALDLAALPPAEPPPAGLTITPVTDGRSLDAYLDALDAAFVEDGIGSAESIAAVRPLIRDHLAAGLPEERVPRRWVGTWDGEPIATARVSLAGRRRRAVRDHDPRLAPRARHRPGDDARPAPRGARRGHPDRRAPGLAAGPAGLPAAGVPGARELRGRGLGAGPRRLTVRPTAWDAADQPPPHPTAPGNRSTRRVV